MTDAEQIKKCLKSYPNAFIYYDDNSSWTIYKSKEHLDKAEAKADRLEYTDEDYDTKYEKIWKAATVCSGSDNDGYGYASPLVEALASMLGMEVDSI